MKTKNLLFYFLLLPFCSQAQIDIDAVDAIVQQAVHTQFFEGTILIADQGEVVYHKAFGYKDAAQKEAIQLDTHFGLASITKMVTAIVVLQLVEEGKVRLEDHMATLFPELTIPKAKKITVHHLLLHISGLPNERDLIYRSPRTPYEFVDQTLQKGIKNKTFGKFNYANIDYVLLGLLIESIEQKPWQEVVQARVIDKLGLTQTGFLAKDAYPENFAYTFSYGKGDKRKSDRAFHIENFYAAGCMYGTAEDLLKLAQAMYGTILLLEESKNLMFTSYPEYSYTGYSVWTYKYPFVDTQPLIMERRGGIMGSNSVLVRLLDTNQALIILSNNDKFNPDSFGDKDNLREALIRVIATGN